MMSKVGRFEDLKVWQSAIEIAAGIFHTCASGQLKTDFGTKDQLQRAAMSISNNIAEGFEYDNTANFIRFLREKRPRNVPPYPAASIPGCH